MRALLLLLAACSSTPASMCEPFKSVNLPQVTRVDRCDKNSVSGETTAAPAAFKAAFAAAGYEIGRDVNEPSYAKNWWIVRKGADSFRVSATFEPSESRKNLFWMIQRDDARKWMPEATWESLATIPHKRDAVLARWREADAIFARGARGAKTCPALDGLDPALANAPLLDVESSELTGTHASHHGPALFPGGIPSNDTSGSYDLDRLVEHLARLQTLEPRRILPVIRVTSYDAPSVPSGLNVTGTFTPGKATFEVGVVDLTEKRVLCRGRGKAESSAVIEATTTTERNPDGSLVDISTTADAGGDLARNIETAAFKELAKMSPVFAKQPAAARR